MEIRRGKSISVCAKNGNSGTSLNRPLGNNAFAFISYAINGFVFFFSWSKYYSDSNGTYNQNISWKFYHTRTDPETGKTIILNNESPFSTTAPAMGDCLRVERTTLGAGVTQYFVIYQKAYRDSTHYHEQWLYVPLYYEDLGNMTLSYSNNTATLTGNSNAVWVLEYNRQNYTPLPNYTQEQKDLFFNCSSRGFEWGPYTSAYSDRFVRWNTGTKVIKVVHNTSTTTTARTRINNGVDNFITLTNAIIGNYMTFTRNDNATTYDILVTSGTHLENWGYEPTGDWDYMYAGEWQTNVGTYFINSAQIFINNEIDTYSHFTTPEGVCLEELYQTLGAGFDYLFRADFISTEFNYPNKNPNAVYNDIDIAFLNLMYNEPSIASNMSGISLAQAINPTYATLCNERQLTFDLSPLGSGIYNVRYWQARYITPVDGEPSGLYTDYITPASDWQTITVIGRPAPWNWSVSLTSGSTNGIVMDNINKRIKVLTAVEINAFLDHIQAVANYYGITISLPSHVNQYDPVTATFANQIRTALNTLGCYGVSEVTAGNKINAVYFNNLRDSINGKI